MCPALKIKQLRGPFHIHKNKHWRAESRGGVAEETNWQATKSPRLYDKLITTPAFADESNNNLQPRSLPTASAKSGK